MEKTESTVNEITTAQAAEAPQTVVAGRPVRQYLQLIIGPVFLSLVVLAAAEFTEVFPGFEWLVYLVIFSYLGWALYSRQPARIWQSAFAGAASGFWLGFMIALFRFIIHPKVYLFFEIITWPIMLSLIGFAIAGAAYWLASGEFRNFKLLNLIKK
ncbi:MAG: hypothetical protein WC734_04395 [Patescibacteria group bacterium]